MRWLASLTQVLDTLIRLRARSVRGNHDDAILHRWHAWHETGTPLKPQHAWLEGMQPRHVEALDSLPFTISIPSYGITVVRDSFRMGLDQIVNDSIVKTLFCPLLEIPDA